MTHIAIEQVLRRAERAREDSDFTYFFSLLLAAEALTKTTTLGLIACLADDKDRHRYRLEHDLAHSDSLGDWGRTLEDALTGPASQFLIADARPEQTELTQLHKKDGWQHEAVSALKASLDHLGIDAEEVPVKSDMKRWFRLFATLRNGTRAHGATPPERTAVAATHLNESIRLFYTNHILFRRAWAYLYRNLSGKYRVSAISDIVQEFEYLKRASDKPLSLANGVYVFVGSPRAVPLMQAGPELDDFLFPNGAFTGKKYELLSYVTDNKANGDASRYTMPPVALPSSETEGAAEVFLQRPRTEGRLRGAS